MAKATKKTTTQGKTETKVLSDQERADRIQDGPLPVWNGLRKGDVTRAGCKVVQIRRDPNAVVGHNVLLEVECLETKKPFWLHAQDAFQTKYHPDVRKQKQLQRRRELRVAKKAEQALLAS